MAISDKIQELAERVTNEANTNPPSQTAQTLHELATKAIIGGIEDWVAYMKLFADPANPAELARLIPTADDPDDKRAERQTARAYLVANGMCTDETTGTLQMSVTKKLDL